MMKVKASPNHGVSAAELARASAAHKRDGVRQAETAVVRDTFKPGPVRRRKPVPEAKARARREPPFDSPGGYVGTNGVPPKLVTRGIRASVRTGNKPSSGLRKLMDRANKHYDRGDYEAAQQGALGLLKENPNNIRMLRIVVSTACVMGDGDQARKYAQKLPKRDKAQLASRCKRYQIDL